MISNRNSKTVQIQFDTEVISSCQLMYCRQYLEGHRKKSHKEVGKGKADLKLIRSVNETFFLFIKYFLLHSIPDFLLRIKNTIYQEIVVDVAKAAVEDDGDDDEDIVDDGEGDDGEDDDALQDQQGHFQVALSLLAH